MGQNETMAAMAAMAAIAAKPLNELTYAHVRDAYIYQIRRFDPVGIRFCFDEAEIDEYRLNAKAKAKLTYCRYLPWREARVRPCL
jgi:hypothetical protein